MFNSKEYWKNRKAATIVKDKKGKVVEIIPRPRRGQGPMIKIKHFDKGEVVMLDDKRQIPNSLGQNLVKVKNEDGSVGFEKFNRSTAHRLGERLKDETGRPLTKKGSKQLPVHLRKKRIVTPLYPPHLTNKQRMKLRAGDRRARSIDQSELDMMPKLNMNLKETK